jgi:hypothetical protein
MLRRPHRNNNSQQEKEDYDSELGIRIQIRVFLGLPDPDPLVRGTDPAPDSSLFHKGVERTEIMLAK